MICLPVSSYQQTANKPVDKLDLRITSLSSESSSRDAEVLFSGGEVSIDTLTTEKVLLGPDGGSGVAGIMCESSRSTRLFTVQYFTSLRVEFIRFLGFGIIFAVIKLHEERLFNDRNDF